MEISINPNIIFNFLLFFAVAYFFAWLLAVKFWLVKFFAVIGVLKLLELALGTGSYAIVTSVILAYIVFFRENILRLFQGFIEWFYIIKDHLEALIRIIFYPFIYAYKVLFTGFASIREKVNQSSQSSNSNNTWQDEEVNRAKEEAYRQSQESDEIRKKAEREKEYYKEQAKKAREEAKKQEQDNGLDSGQNNSSKPDTRSPEQILGLQAGFSKMDLKKAYKSLASRYHPDRYVHMSIQLQDEMAEEFKKVSNSYKNLLGRL